MNKKWIVAIFLCLFVGGSLIYVNIRHARAGVEIPDTKDARDIQDVIRHSYTVFRGALRNGGNVSEFEEVFTNTSDYTYENEDVKAFVALVLGTEEADVGGYLTVMKAKYIAYGCAVQSYREMAQQAKKEGRGVTGDDLRSIQDLCYGIVPPSLSEGSPPQLDFVRIDIQGDRAIARYDDGAALMEVILVRQDGKWRIADMNPIEIHF